MNKKDFYNEIDSILKEGKIENIPINNIDIIKFILKDKYIKDELYNDFQENYNIIYGNDKSNYYMKLQDFVYRLNLLVNYNMIGRYDIFDKNTITDAVKKLVYDKSIDLFSSVSYDIFDLEIVEDQELDVREALMSKEI